MSAERVAIIAALPGEIKPLIRGWEATRAEGEILYRTRLEGIDVVAVCCGIGREPAARACTLAMQGGRLSAIVSIGWTGALSCGMKPGQAFAVHEVVDASTGERYRAAAEPSGPAEIRLVTTKRIAGKAEKRRLAEEYDAALVDMEAATVGRLARVNEIPFYCLKAVSDEANAVLPDMNPFLTRAGKMNVCRFVTSVLLRPRYWRELIRMGRNSSSGAEALAAGVKQLLGEMKHADNS
jgi:adenosylhomocysteine nucleosidase